MSTVGVQLQKDSETLSMGHNKLNRTQEEITSISYFNSFVKLIKTINRHTRDKSFSYRSTKVEPNFNLKR